MPAFCISNIIAGSTISTPTGIFSTPASLSSENNSLACFSISPNEGCTVPRRPNRPALQFSGFSQGA